MHLVLLRHYSLMRLFTPQIAHQELLKMHKITSFREVISMFANLADAHEVADLRVFQNYPEKRYKV